MNMDLCFADKPLFDKYKTRSKVQILFCAVLCHAYTIFIPLRERDGANINFTTLIHNEFMMVIHVIVGGAKNQIRTYEDLKMLKKYEKTMKSVKPFGSYEVTNKHTENK